MCFFVLCFSTSNVAKVCYCITSKLNNFLSIFVRGLIQEVPFAWKSPFILLCDLYILIHALLCKLYHCYALCILLRVVRSKVYNSKYIYHIYVFFSKTLMVQLYCCRKIYLIHWVVSPWQMFKIVITLPYQICVVSATLFFRNVKHHWVTLLVIHHQAKYQQGCHSHLIQFFYLLVK